MPGVSRERFLALALQLSALRLWRRRYSSSPGRKTMPVLWGHKRSQRFSTHNLDRPWRDATHMKPMTNQCEHGSLARQCLICELQAENKRLQNELDQWTEVGHDLTRKVERLQRALEVIKSGTDAMASKALGTEAP